MKYANLHRNTKKQSAKIAEKERRIFGRRNNTEIPGVKTKMSDQEQEKGPNNNNANDQSRHGDCDTPNPCHAQAGVEVVDLAQLIKATVAGVMAEMAQPRTPGSEPKPSTSQAPDKEGRKRCDVRLGRPPVTSS